MDVQNNKKMTIDDIARELGVSKTTVSRAISGKGRIGEETRQKVQSYIQQHNYVPNALAKGLANSRTYNIGVALPQDLMFSDIPFFPRALKGISEVASREECDVILTVIDNRDLSQLERVISNKKVDGIILMRTLHRDEPAEYLKQCDVPFVAIGMSDDPEIYQIDNDHVDACSELTSILLMKGLKKIAIITGSMDYMINRKRLEGYYLAHQKVGIPVNEKLVFQNAETPIMISRITDTILLSDANCIIGTDDYITSILISKLQEEEIIIPEDMRVASFYDSNLLSMPKLGVTTIKFDVEELGREACRVLFRRINHQDAQRITQLSYEVTLRESTK